MDDDQNVLEFQVILNNTFEECIRDGFDWPIYLAIFGSDGSMGYLRYDGRGVEPDPLARYRSEGEGEIIFPPPMHLYFSDLLGHARWVKLKKPRFRLVK